MHPVVEEVFSSGKVVTADGTTIKAHSHIPRDECELIYRMAHKIKATRAVEIGMAYGISSVCLCDALRQVAEKNPGAPTPNVTIIDPHQFVPGGWQGIGLKQIERAGFRDMVEFQGQESCAALPALLAQGRKFDLAFVDGRHTFDSVLTDFFYLDKLVDVGGILIFDDASYQSIHAVMRFILCNRDYELVEALTEYPVPPMPGKAKSLVKSFFQRLGRTNRSAHPEDKAKCEVLVGKHSVALMKKGEDTRDGHHFRHFP